MDDRLKLLLDMIEKLESRLNSYWNFFSVVAIAVSGWLVTARATFTAADSAALTLAVAIFFASNLAVIRAATLRLIAFEAELNATAPGSNLQTETLRRNLMMPAMPGRMAGTYILHLAVDAGVIYLIWSKVA